jgi:hypothetical protein
MKRESLTYGNIEVDIHYDQDAENPRMNFTETKFVMFHKRYKMPNETGIPNYSEFFTSWEEMEADLQSKFKHVVPVYMLDHSGLSFSLTDFNDPWDSGQIGFIVSNERTREEFLVNARSELSIYDIWVKGECYGFAINNLETEDTESVWGFYGYDHEKSGLLESMYHSLKFSFKQSPEAIAEILESFK